MALNPPLQPNRHPAPVQGEYLVLVRKNIEAEVLLENKQKYKGSGKLYLTTLRMVFVNDKNETMTSFDVPIDLMTNEKFNQPIFGANYISGHVRPLYNLIPCPATFKFWFMSGGTGTFLPLFYNITEQIRKRRQNGNQGPDPRFVECVANGNLRNVAYVDPNDPSVIFIQQPAVQAAPVYNAGYYFPQAGMAQPPPPMAYPQGSQVSNNPPYSSSPPSYNPGPAYNSPPVYNAAPVYDAAPVYNASQNYSPNSNPSYNPPQNYSPNNVPYPPQNYSPNNVPSYNPPQGYVPNSIPSYNSSQSYPQNSGYIPPNQVPNYPPPNTNSAYPDLPPNNYSNPPPVSNPPPSNSGYSQANPYLPYH